MTDQQAAEVPITKIHISLMEVEETPGGNPPGIYWSMDPNPGPDSIWAGPYPDGEAAMTAAKEFIEKVYFSTVKMMLGDL